MSGAAVFGLLGVLWFLLAIFATASRDVQRFGIYSTLGVLFFILAALHRIEELLR